MKSRARSFGADLDELETERNIVFEIDDNKKRRTIQLTRDKGSWGFTIQVHVTKTIILVEVCYGMNCRLA